MPLRSTGILGRLESRAIRESGDLPVWFTADLRGKVESYIICVYISLSPISTVEVGDFFILNMIKYFFVSLWLASALIVSQADETDVIHLDEIVISATRTPASLDSISASTVIVPEAQIRSSTAADLSHLLGTANVLSVSDYGPGSLASASIRGSSSEQVLVLVDGRRINDSRSGMADLNNIPVTYAKQIEILRGGQSAMYGADAVGGIINIITKQPAGTTARAWSTLGAYNSLSWGIEASSRIETLSGIISLSKMDTKSNFPFEDKYGRELTRENADSSSGSIFGKLKLDVSDSINLRLSGDYYHSNKGDPGPIGQYTPDANRADESNGQILDIEHNLKKWLLYKLSFYNRGSRLRYTNPQQPYPIDDTHKTDNTGSDLQVYMFTSNPLIFGISLMNDDITSTSLGDKGRRTYSGYVQQQIGSLQNYTKIRVFPAVRWDHYSDFHAGISPKLGFLTSFGQYRFATIKANVGRSYRAPTLNELYWPSDAFAMGNPDLKPERSTDMDVGIHFHISETPSLRWLSQARCSITCFQSFSRNRIQWSPGANGKWSPQNLSESRSAGLEAEAWTYISARNVPDLVSFSANYTFLKAEDTLKRQLIYRPRHSLGYTLRVGTRDIWGQIQGLYRGRRYYTVQNTKWLEPFMRHDIKFGMERRLWKTGNAGIVLEIKNIFDKRYQLVADYPLPGREWSIKTSIGMEGE